MKIASFDELNWKKDHPTGNISFQHLLKGQPGTRENFMYVLGRQDADFLMPTHRHNFDQIRLPIRGTMNHGKGIVVGEGEVAYIPEGVAYGPQEDPLAPYAAGERLQLVLQFGGSSGLGFMSIEQRRQAIRELAEVGTFAGPYFHRNDGTSAWGLNAIWEHVFGERIRYPRPRYKSIIIADPARFQWLPVDGAAGVEHKFMGAFSERGVWIEMLRLQPGAVWTSTDPRATRLLVILAGSGEAANQPIGQLSAVDVSADETLRLTASTGLEVFLVGLPPVEIPAVSSDQYDSEEIPAEAALA